MCACCYSSSHQIILLYLTHTLSLLSSLLFSFVSFLLTVSIVSLFFFSLSRSLARSLSLSSPLQRLKEGVRLDMERQERKRQNQRELEEQIELQKRLEEIQRQEDAAAGRKSS